MRWRGTHNTLAMVAVLGGLTGLALLGSMSKPAARLVGEVHLWMSLPAIPLLVWLLWLGRRMWLRLGGGRSTLHQLNRGLSRMTLILLAAVLATGVLLWDAHTALQLIRARTLHRIASEALAPALGGHLLIGVWLWVQRRSRA